MRLVVPICLLIVAAIHAAPIMGALGASQLHSVYAIDVRDSNLELLLRHRAVLFGVLAALLAVSAFYLPLRTAAILAGGASVVSFLLLSLTVGEYNAAIRRIVVADLLALPMLAVAALLHWRPLSEA